MQAASNTSFLTVCGVHVTIKTQLRPEHRATLLYRKGTDKSCGKEQSLDRGRTSLSDQCVWDPFKPSFRLCITTSVATFHNNMTLHAALCDSNVLTSLSDYIHTECDEFLSGDKFTFKVNG